MQGVTLIEVNGRKTLLTCVGITLCVSYHPRLRKWWRHGYVFYLPHADEHIEYFKKLQDEGYMCVGLGIGASPPIATQHAAYIQITPSTDSGEMSLYAYSLSYTSAALIGASTPDSLRQWLHTQRVPCYDIADESVPIETYVRHLYTRVT